MAASKSKKKKTIKKKIAIRKKQKTRVKRAAPLLKKTQKRKSKKTIRKKSKTTNVVALVRASSNPIISPVAHRTWESKATFNPSAVYGGGKVHLIYRAIGEGDVSVFGYAGSSDGVTIDIRGKSPAFAQGFLGREKSHMTMPVLYGSGGGWNGGSEDPRLTLLGDRVFMLYTSFDGWGSVRIALTSISFDNFVNERWRWKTPVFVSPPGEIHKNWVLFPEKINGKYAILHGISQSILIDYVDDIDSFDGAKFIQSKHPGGGYKDAWDNALRGVGPAPIKTAYGWLVLYHAMDIKDPNRYKLGAMLLDLEEPTKVLVRSRQPILEPDEWYENEGFKSGVVYACGAIVKDGWLFVYYGGADKVVCVAAAELEPFLKSLRTLGSTKLARKNISPSLITKH
ncbi:MAG: glycosidase [Parcubacteria group bacterium]|nr:glycosidase [Parcubacteria group bacterium]